MSSHNKNISFLVIGIMAGILVGGTVGWWLKPVRTLTTKILAFRPDSIFQFRHKDNDELKKIKLVELKNQQGHQNTRTSESNLKYDSSKDPFLDSLESTLNPSQKDSLLKNSTDGGNGKEIVVKKDELLFVKETEFSSKKDSRLDSLLTDATPSSSGKNTIRIEFWFSPVNYRGYKIDDNKLIIYGINDFNEATLISFNKLFYLKIHNDFFPIEPSNNFKPLVKLINHNLITQLNTHNTK